MITDSADMVLQEPYMTGYSEFIVGRAIDHVVSRLRSKPPAEAQPSAPVGVEGFEQWYARVDARFWNNWDACNAAFHAGKRAAIAQQPAAANKPAGYPVGNQPREARSE